PLGMATKVLTLGLSAVMTPRSRSISSMSPTSSGRARTSHPRSRVRSGRPAWRTPQPPPHRNVDHAHHPRLDAPPKGTMLTSGHGWCSLLLVAPDRVVGEPAVRIRRQRPADPSSSYGQNLLAAALMCWIIPSVVWGR